MVETLNSAKVKDSLTKDISYFCIETRLYYYGARYYNPRTSTWLSADPILGKYLPTGNKEHDKNLPGMGGVFNHFNLNLYAYAHQNPVKLVDPDGARVGIGLAIIKFVPMLARAAWSKGVSAWRWASSAYNYGTAYASAYPTVQLGLYSQSLLDKGGKAIGTVFTSGAGKRLVTPVLNFGKQTMKKLGQHAKDWGLGSKGKQPSGWENTMKDIAKSMYKDATAIRKGDWRPGKRGSVKDVTFYKSDKGVLVTNTKGEVVTILKKGKTNPANNESFKMAKEVWKK